MFVNHGVDINATSGRCGNTLHVAAFEGHEAIVQLLLDSGAEINGQVGDRTTALIAAVYNGQQSGIRLLLERGADVHIRGRWVDALNMAACHGMKYRFDCFWRAEQISMLLEKFGPRPLQMSLVNGFENVARILLENGADVTLKGGQFGKNPCKLLAPTGPVWLL